MTVHQCATCSHWQRRGGIVRRATFGCTAFDEEWQGSERATMVIIAAARALADGNRCPVYAPHVIYPDSYLAQDMPETADD